MKGKRKSVLALLLAAVLFVLPLAGIMNAQAEATGDTMNIQIPEGTATNIGGAVATPTQFIAPRSGDFYTVTGFTPPEWDGKTYKFQPGSTKAAIDSGLPSHELEITLDNEDNMTLTITEFVNWEWLPEITESEAVIPIGSYTLTARPPSVIVDMDSGEFFDLRCPPEITLPTITVVISSSESIETVDYGYEATTGKLTIKTSAGMTSWRTDVWPNDVKTLLINANVSEITGFSGCSNLTQVTFGSGCSPDTIGDNAFYNCVSLTTIDIANVTTIGDSAFYNCVSLTNIDIANVTTIGDSAFYNCVSLTDIDIASVTTIGNSAFENCAAITAITIPAGMTEVSPHAFSGTGISSITIPNTITGGFFIRNCPNLTTVTFGGTSQLTHFDISDCDSLTNIVLPDSVKTMSVQTCPRLETVNLPASLENQASGFGYGIFEKPDDPHGLLFRGCFALKEVKVSPDNAHFMDIDGVVFSKDGTILYYCPIAIDATEYIIPANVKIIAGCAFAINRTLEKVIIHKNVEEIAGFAFAYALNLRWADIEDDEDGSGLVRLGDGAFYRETNTNGLDDYDNYPRLDVNLPRSLPLAVREQLLYMFSDLDFDEDVANAWLGVYYDSEIAAWCKENNCNFYYRPDSIALKATPPDLMYKYIPYMFTPQTTIPSNEDLYFWLEDENGNPLTLPEGLTLYDGITLPADAPANIRPGVIYGAPLDYTAFKDGVEFTMKACNKADVNKLYPAIAEFTIQLAPTPTNEEMETKVNIYPIIPMPDGDDGRIDYVITGDKSSYAKDQILHIDGEYRLFDSLWIDGIKQIISAQYNAEDGSTTVTIFAQTIKDLDNGTHTAAAAFRTESGGPNKYDSQLDVVAQNFTVDLTAGGNPDPGDTNPGDGDSGDTGSGETSSAGTGSGGTSSGETPSGGPGSGNTNPGGSNDGGDTNNASDARQSGSTAPDAPAFGESSSAPEPATVTAPPAAAESTAAPETAPDEEGNTGALLGGLDVDENGEYFFIADGVTPLEPRIDKPFEIFEGMRFNGEPWTLGEDYAARPGSTILSIPAKKVAELPSGVHTISAEFMDGEVVNISFRLINAAADMTEEAKLGLAPIFIILAVLIVGGVLAVIIKKRAAVR